MRTVLVVDDNPAVAEALRVLFALHDIDTRSAQSPDEGVELVHSESIDLVIADMNFQADTTSGQEGVELFRAIREINPDLPVILLTGWASVEAAVNAVKAGAADYISKPWDNAKLLTTVENLLELSEANRDRRSAQISLSRRRAELESRFDLRGVKFASDAMERVVEMACRVARADVPVLVTGPNGAGKERVAEIVHANSTVREGPFVAVNCGAIPTDLVESELFGAEAGAYTGAARSREGRFALANNGTLFLDEIGNLPLSGQVKLLRVLETGQYQKLGSSQSRSTKVRVVSATNANIPRMIAAGQFREDLYYRLNVIEIAVPPLSERPEDIVAIAEHFLGKDYVLSLEARNALLRYAWPGNVRELRNALERVKVMVQPGIVGAGDLNLPNTDAMQRNLVGPGHEHISQALADAGGNVSRAAQSLGLSRQALYRRMQRLGISH